MILGGFVIIFITFVVSSIFGYTY